MAVSRTKVHSQSRNCNKVGAGQQGGAAATSEAEDETTRRRRGEWRPDRQAAPIVRRAAARRRRRQHTNKSSSLSLARCSLSRFLSLPWYSVLRTNAAPVFRPAYLAHTFGRALERGPPNRTTCCARETPSAGPSLRPVCCHGFALRHRHQPPRRAKRPRPDSLAPTVSAPPCIVALPRMLNNKIWNSK